MMQKKIKYNNATGFQDKILREKFLGTYDVHLNNLTAPHPSRSTRLLDHDHVSTLTYSYQENNMGQFVILVGMVTSGTTDPARLKVDGYGKVEVLGGNHTRQAMQTLLEKGTLTTTLVKVNIYQPLPVTAALAIGYQHNTILHEKKRPLHYIEKVRLMRYCRPSHTMTKDEMTKWKDMLVVVFRTKDRRRLMNMYQQHLQMAKLPDNVWTKVAQAIERIGPVKENFFQQLMRISDNVEIEKSLDTLTEMGQKAFKNQVKEVTDQGCVRSKKKTSKEQSKELVAEHLSGEPVKEQLGGEPVKEQFSGEPVKEQLGGEQVKEQVEIVDEDKQKEVQYMKKHFSLKIDHESLQAKYEKIMSENIQLKKDLKKIKSVPVEKECRGGTKRQSESTLEEFSIGQVVEALWKDENGEEWLEAKVLRRNQKGVRVQYTIDSGIASVSTSWVRTKEEK